MGPYLILPFPQLRGHIAIAETHPLQLGAESIGRSLATDELESGDEHWFFLTF
jgi:hypothetical protein